MFEVAAWGVPKNLVNGCPSSVTVGACLLYDGLDFMISEARDLKTSSLPPSLPQFLGSSVSGFLSLWVPQLPLFSLS